MSSSLRHSRFQIPVFLQSLDRLMRIHLGHTSPSFSINSCATGSAENDGIKAIFHSSEIPNTPAVVVLSQHSVDPVRDSRLE